MDNNLTTNLFSCTLCRDADFVMNLYTLHLRPLLEYASPLRNIGFLGDVRMLARLQRRWMRVVVGLEDLPYEER